LALTNRFLVIFEMLLGVRDPYLDSAIGKSVLKWETKVVHLERTEEKYGA